MNSDSTDNEIVCPISSGSGNLSNGIKEDCISEEETLGEFKENIIGGHLQKQIQTFDFPTS